jgi:hypothetical protein
MQKTIDKIEKDQKLCIERMEKHKADLHDEVADARRYTAHADSERAR